MREDGNMAPQRRVIRVSEMFAEHRSSGDARSDRRERVVCPCSSIQIPLKSEEISCLQASVSPVFAKPVLQNPASPPPSQCLRIVSDSLFQ